MAEKSRVGACVKISGLLKRPKKVFYGWWILLAGVVNSALTGGASTYGFSAFFLPICNEFGWKRAVMSLPIALSRLEGALLGPVEGFLVDRFGPRKLMFIGAILMGTGFVLLSRVQSLAMFYVVFFCFMGLGGGIIFVSIQVAVANWFRKRRALGIGIIMGGLNVGAMLTPAVVWLITTRGWRETAFIIGLTMWVVQIPISLVMRHRPEPYGYLPDGMTEQQAKAEEAEPKRESALAEQDFTPRQALRTPAFYFLTLTYACRLMVIAAIPIHLIPFIQDLGYSAAQGGSVMALMGFCSLIGRVGMSALADILPKRYVLAACMAEMAIAVFFLSTAQSMWQLFLWAVIYAPGYGGPAGIQPAMIADYYGRKHFGTINGLTHIAMAVTTMVGPVFAGYVFDVTGSYRIAFISFAVVCAVGAVSIIFAKRPQLPAAPEAMP
ncbi:MFS transporter [Chloroflexota bacterium]